MLEIGQKETDNYNKYLEQNKIKNVNEIHL